MLGALRAYGWFVGAGVLALIVVVLGQGLVDVLRDRRNSLLTKGLPGQSSASGSTDVSEAGQERHADRSTES